MLKRLVTISLAITLLIISILTYAQENYYSINLPVFELETNENIKLLWENADISGNNIEDKILNSFEKLIDLNYNEKKMKLIPDNTKILSVFENEGNLEVNFSKDILDYGGTTWEYYLINQLLLTSFIFDDINSVSFFIDNNITTFVEGTQIQEYTREDLEERMKVNAKSGQ